MHTKPSIPQNKRNAPSRRRRIYFSLLTFAALASLLITALLLLARFHWRLEILSHFRLPFTLGLVLLLLLLVAVKARQRALLVGFCLLLQAIPLSQHYLPFTKDSREGSGPRFKVVTFNVLTRNKNHQEVHNFLQQQNADFIGLQEISREWVQALAPLSQSYPYSIEHPRSDNFGLLFFSKYPILSHNLDESPELGTPYLMVKIDWQGQPLTLIVSHALPPTGPTCAQARNNTFERMRADVSHSQSPLVLMGDLNCSTYSPYFKIASEGLRDSSRGRGYPATWRRGNPILGIPIDHMLYSDSLVCKERQIGPKHGSDHSPIIAIFQQTKD